MKLYQKLISLVSLLVLMLIGCLLIGKTINLTSDNIAIASSNFSVDKDGNMTCKNADISGKVTIGGDESNPEFIATDGNNKTYIYPLGLLNEVNGDYVAIMKGAIGLGTYTSNSMSETVNINNQEIKAPIITQTSKEEAKKNFEKLENGLDIIKDIDIYRYNLKSEDDTTKKHIGFVIGDNYNYSKEVTSNNNDGVDIYSFVSICCKAIQEQQEQIETLKQEIKELQEKDKQKDEIIADLIKRIENLEKGGTE